MTTVPFRVSKQSKQVMEALMRAPREWHYGYPLAEQTGLKSGTLYPILRRMQEHGWLETKWEESEEEGRPRRHMYRLTGVGLRGVREVLGEARLKKLEAAWGTRLAAGAGWAL